VGNAANYWTVSEKTVDLSRGILPRITMHSETTDLIFAPVHSALIVVDMQNYFCSPELSRPDAARNIVGGIQNALAAVRRIHMPVAWVNWGNRPDEANLPPSVLYAFQNNSPWGGIGGDLPGGLGPALPRKSPIANGT
jgi:nicotinamidase-related amidase